MIEVSCSGARHLRTNNYSVTSKTAVIAPSTWEVIISHPPNLCFSKTLILISLPFLGLVFVWHYLIPLSSPSYACFTFLVLNFKPICNSIQSCFSTALFCCFFLLHVPVIQLGLCQETEISSEFIMFYTELHKINGAFTCENMKNGTPSHRSS